MKGKANEGCFLDECARKQPVLGWQPTRGSMTASPRFQPREQWRPAPSRSCTSAMEAHRTVGREFLGMVRGELNTSEPMCYRLEANLGSESSNSLMPPSSAGCHCQRLQMKEGMWSKVMSQATPRHSSEVCLRMYRCILRVPPGIQIKRDY